MIKRFTLALIAVTLFASFGCTSVEDVSGASKSEITSACSALSRVGYDYWQLDPIGVGGRTLEVAASIHTLKKGPDNVRKYCTSR